MPKKTFLYCEETDTKIYKNDVVTISTHPETKWIVKNGWYSVDGNQKNGWHFVSIEDKSILPIDQVDIKDITNESRQGGTGETRPEPKETSAESEIPDYIEIPDSLVKLKGNDIVTISDYPDTKWVLKLGWYKIGTAQRNGYYFIDISSRMLLPIEDVDLSHISKEAEQGTSELRPTLQDIDTTPAESKFIVIPGTDIRLYDGDIVKISNKPRVKWIVHLGWYIYGDVQNYGWYFVSVKNGEILPVSAIDLTLCTLVTVKTQGSEIYDGKVVNYTRPFTESDAKILNRTFITLETIEQRDNLDKKKLVNGRLVRVNNVGGAPNYYAWNAKEEKWDIVDFGGGGGIPEIIGTAEQPIILSLLEPGLYRVKGTYKISPEYATTFITTIDHIAFVAGDDEINIKVVTEHNITDYIVEDDAVTFINNYATVLYLEQNYATKVYVDNKIAVIEGQISEIMEEFHDKVVEIVYEVLDLSLNGIEEEYIDNLFS